VAKVNAAGNDLVYSTFLCGSGDDSPNGIGVDPDGHAYVAGYTGSSDFPTQPSQPHPGGMCTYNGFVTKLTPDGSALVYSTYLGGDSDDVATGLAVHAASRNAYVTGPDRTTSRPPLAPCNQITQSHALVSGPIATRHSSRGSTPPARECTRPTYMARMATKATTLR
jgi:hypothetical protein